MRLLGSAGPGLDDYREDGGYAGLLAAWKHGPEWLRHEVRASGLRGRGGTWCPLGEKWDLALGRDGQRFVIANGAEVEPGSLKDRRLLSDHPHLVVEGALLSAFAIESDEIIFYLSAESATHPLDVALEEARWAHLLAGVEVVTFDAPSNYVAGEASAAVEFIERGLAEPRFKPPEVAVWGLQGQATVVSNIETLAHLPLIAAHGAEWFREVGTEPFPGTMLLTLPPETRRPGVHEVPLGSFLDEVINEVGGGLSDGPARGVQVGGVGSGWIGGDYHVPLEPEALAARGSALGCGAVRVLPEDHCAVDAVTEAAAFLARESCGKCPPCRLGSQRLARALTAVREGAGVGETLTEALNEAAKAFDRGACDLSNYLTPPVVSAMRLFPEDFETHLTGRPCRRRHPRSAL
jgi:NADH-quinone oxidoreductase subunit F